MRSPAPTPTQLDAVPRTSIFLSDTPSTALARHGSARSAVALSRSAVAPRTATLAALMALGFSTACAVGEPLKDEAITAAAQSIDPDPVMANGDSDPSPSAPVAAVPKPASGGAGNSSNLPGSPSGAGTLPSMGAGGATPSDASPSGTRLVPMAPMPTQTGTAAMPTDTVSMGGTGGLTGVGELDGGVPMGGSGGAVPMLTPEEYAASDVVVYYVVSNTTDMGPIRCTMSVVNQIPSQRLPLTEVTLRYWYDNDGFTTPIFQNNYNGPAAAASGDPADKPVFTVGTDGDYTYVEISMPSGADIPHPDYNYESATEIQFEITGDAYDQTNDWSFNPALTARAPNPRITAYRRGVLIWGEEPDGDEPAERPELPVGGSGGTPAAGGSGGTSPAGGSGGA